MTEAVAVPESKTAIHSLTLWFNAIVGTLAMSLDTIIPQIENALPALAAVLPESLMPVMIFILAVGNAVIRFRTNQAVTLMKR